ncbi:MAG: hypothetical protein JXR27_12425 [Paludibacteraceae bacterium]|nr:hypothetical protein [Paludibacteraceae bacterium]
MIVDDFMGLHMAWIASLPVTFVLAVYVYFVYRRILEWFLFSTAIYLTVALLATILPDNTITPDFNSVRVEFILLAVFAFSLLFRTRISAFINSRNKKMLSMVNNLNELFRMIWILAVIIFLFTHIYSIALILKLPNLENSLGFIYSVYVSVLLFVLFYEMIRVTIVRVRLLKEEWWPIVNEQGKTIGSIQHHNSLNSHVKYMHPIVRVMLIDNNRVYLQKRSETDLVFPGLWDTAISNHIKVSETLEHCIKRTAEERYSMRAIKPLFLSNYIHETDFEYHYAFLFVACYADLQDYNKKLIDHAKWWTVNQIEENLEEGIFTENFKTEFDLLKRSGLLESVQCECECSLRDLVADSSDKISQN